MFPIVEAGSPALEGTTLPAFVVARDGLYLRKQSLLGLSQTKVERVAHLPAGKPFLDYRLPKLPAELMGQVVGFFRAVYDRQQTEALVLLLWQDDRFELLVPSQSTTSVSVRHKLDLVGPAGRVPPGRHDPLARRLLGLCECDRRRRRGGPRRTPRRRRRSTPATAIVVGGARRRRLSLRRPPEPGARAAPGDRAAARRVAGASEGSPRATAQVVAEGAGAHAAAGQDGGRWAIARPAKARRTPRRRGSSCREARLSAPRRSRADIRHDRRSGRCLVASSLSVVAASAHSCWRHWFGISLHSSREALLVLVDGDVFEYGNALRQEFPASAVGLTRPRPSPAGSAKQVSPARRSRST